MKTKLKPKESVEQGSTEQEKKGAISRRDFLSLSALGLASLTILPSWIVDGKHIPPSDRIVMGFVGMGQQGYNDMQSFFHCPGIQVAACCDVDSIKRERARRKVVEWQKSQGVAQRCDVYEFYEDLLERKDIDAIEVATPDHWHALICIGALDSGKDVYCQKPLPTPSPKDSPYRQPSATTTEFYRWVASNAQVPNSSKPLRWCAKELSAISTKYTSGWVTLPSHSTYPKCLFPPT